MMRFAKLMAATALAVGMLGCSDNLNSLLNGSPGSNGSLDSILRGIRVDSSHRGDRDSTNRGKDTGEVRHHDGDSTDVRHGGPDSTGIRHGDDGRRDSTDIRHSGDTDTTHIEHHGDGGGEMDSTHTDHGGDSDSTHGDGRRRGRH